MRDLALVTLASVLLMGGCNGPLPSASEESSEPSAASSGGVADQTAAGKESNDEAASEDRVAVKAKPGVGIRGRSLDNESGILVTPAKTLFTVREKAVFEIQIPQALQLFQATEGRKPSSHEEFMSRIVKANNIKLPELPPGQKYQYYPDRGELMVIRPK